MDVAELIKLETAECETQRWNQNSQNHRRNFSPQEFARISLEDWMNQTHFYFFPQRESSPLLKKEGKKEEKNCQCTELNIT